MDRTARRCLGGVTAVALLVNTWALSINGLGNQYYAAAARSMSGSWSNFFFVSLDPGGFISVDKPPLFLWIDAASVRLFGVGSWSLLLPSALAGTAAVALLWCTVHRRFGTAAATISAAVLALSPINVAVNRLNLPEPFLILLLVAAAWAVLRALDSPRPLAWAALAGGFVGLAFNVKMFAAYLPLPALGLALVIGLATWRRRVSAAAVFGAVTVAVSLAWLVVVDLVPASARPYVGGSTNDSVWNLLWGYNGLGRVEGTGQFGGGPSGAMSGAGGVFGGVAGPFRLLSDAVGGQIAWLLPVAVLGLVAAAWLHRRDRVRVAAIVLWAGWLGIAGLVFSYAGGTFHSYYTSLLTPALAALVGVGATALVPLVRRHPAWLAAAGVTLVATIALQRILAEREPSFEGWAPPVALALALTGVVVAAVAVGRRNGRRVVAGLTIALAATLVTPTAWALSETANPVLNATLPQAGPRTGVAGATFGSASSDGDPALAAWLRAHDDGETWDLVTGSAQSASGLIADDGLSVMALGGFMGTDPAITVDRFGDLVAAGEVRYVLVSGGMGGGSPVLEAVRQSCAPVDDADLPPEYERELYDCAGASL